MTFRIGNGASRLEFFLQFLELGRGKILARSFAVDKMCRLPASLTSVALLAEDVEQTVGDLVARFAVLGSRVVQVPFLLFPGTTIGRSGSRGVLVLELGTVHLDVASFPTFKAFPITGKESNELLEEIRVSIGSVLGGSCFLGPSVCRQCGDLP